MTNAVGASSTLTVAAKPKGVAVRLEGLKRTWEDGAGVRGIDLNIPAGSFVALLGPSGCGKSTTLRLVAGLEQPDGGRVLINGQDVTRLAPDKRKLSMVFQSYALFPHLNVAENIVFGLKVRKVPKAERRVRLTRALELTGLTGLEARHPAALSGGQRQRVALARSIVADHPLCLMDEPLSNLDAKLRHSVRREIRALQKRLGITVIYVTHDQSEAMSMADLVVVMRDGRIEQADSPARLYDQPQTAFAAGFVGQPPMAVLPGEALFPQERSMAERLCGLRAADLRVTDRPSRSKVLVHLADAEYLGGETFATAFVKGHSQTPLSLRIPGGVTIEQGMELGLTWPDEALHLFDRQSGHRLPCPADHAGAAQKAPWVGWPSL